MHKRKIRIFFIMFILILLCHSYSAYASDIIVYKTKTGSKYHTHSCGHLHSSISISLKEATLDGLEPCAHCNPPVYSDMDVVESLEPNITSPAPTKPKYTIEEIEAILEKNKNSQDSAIEEEEITPDNENALNRTSSEKIEINSFVLDNIGFFGLCGAIGVFVFVFSRIVARDVKPTKKISSDNIQKLNNVKTNILDGYDYYYSLYAGKEPEDLVTPPTGIFIVDGLPATDHKHKYGLYSVYITPKGTRYHRRKKCANSNNAYLTNLYLVHRKMYPCKMCCQRYNPNMDFEWYEKYLEIKRIKKKYDIP